MSRRCSLLSVIPGLENYSPCLTELIHRHGGNSGPRRVGNLGGFYLSEIPSQWGSGGGGEQEIVTGTIITTIFCRIGALTIFAFVSVVPGSVVMKMKLLYFITCSFLDFVIVG